MGKNTVCQDNALFYLNFKILPLFQDGPPQIAFTLGQYSDLLPYHSAKFDCQMALPKKKCFACRLFT